MTLDRLMFVLKERDLTFADLDAYCALHSKGPDAALDAAALAVARKYADAALDFSVADAAANTLFAYGAGKGLTPDLMMSVFLAFDAGEFYPDNVRDPSPEARFTRPQIAAILAKYAAGAR